MATVFHQGELELQTESRVEVKVDKIGNKLIRDHIIEQHKEFFEALPYVFIALHDDMGKPWISLIQSTAGFINSPDKKTLNLNGKVFAHDLLNLQTNVGSPVGILGIDFSNRRRNRLNGNFKNNEHKSLLSIAVGHSFGNCPKYIQLRTFDADTTSDKTIDLPNKSHQKFKEFDEHHIKLIKESDTFFIASSEKKGGDLDASHRGGNQGFVRIEGNKKLWFNDFPGNNFFQTLGNIHNYSSVGLMFIDFKSGDALLMSGKAVVEKPKENMIENSKFLPRRCYFTLEKGIRVERAIKGQWSPVDMSPFLSKVSD